MKLWHYALIVFLGGCCYGILSTIVKLAYSAGFSALEVTGGQYLFGVVISFLMSGIPAGLTGVFYSKSLQTLDAFLAIILLFQFVWIGTLYEWVLQKRKPAGGKLLSIVNLEGDSRLQLAVQIHDGFGNIFEIMVLAILVRDFRPQAGHRQTNGVLSITQ